MRSHRRFGTAKWILPETLAPGDESARYGRAELPESLDFVTARTEFYEHPTALPTVERSSIKQDLHRRDFTINTLAVRLTPEHWGELLDFYGGRKDLEDGVIRVLHSLSFVEDPTRILRAARFEQRFGFRIEPRTEELIADARDLLDRVSAERVRHELELILAEAEPEHALGRLDDLGVLKKLHPQLACTGWFLTKAPELRADARPDRQLRQPVAGCDGAATPMRPRGSTWRSSLIRCRRPRCAEFLERYHAARSIAIWRRRSAHLSRRLGTLGRRHASAQRDRARPGRVVATRRGWCCGSPATIGWCASGSICTNAACATSTPSSPAMTCAGWASSRAASIV